jgi:hypothetical protein
MTSAMNIIVANRLIVVGNPDKGAGGSVRHTSLQVVPGGASCFSRFKLAGLTR